MDLLKMLAEILNLPQAVDFVESDHSGHYIRTPYAYRPGSVASTFRRCTLTSGRDSCS